MIIKSLLCLYCWALNKTIPGPPTIILNVLEKKCMPFHFFMKIKWSASLFRVNWICMTFSDLQYTREQFQHTLNFKQEKLLVHFAKRWYRIGLDQTMLIHSLLIKYIKALFWLFSPLKFDIIFSLQRVANFLIKKIWKHVKACDRIGLIKFYWNCFVLIFFDKQKTQEVIFHTDFVLLNLS